VFQKYGTSGIEVWKMKEISRLPEASLCDILYYLRYIISRFLEYNYYCIHTIYRYYGSNL